MSSPTLSNPFFTYGIFRPGEIPFLGIEKYVKSIKHLTIKGEVLLRDGVFLYADNGLEEVKGYLIQFKEKKENDAYRHINNLEPKNLYTWQTKVSNDYQFNILVGNTPYEGSESTIPYGLENYSTLEDPYFNSALDVLERGKNISFDSESKGFFEIQMHYLFLWTVIERFNCLSYGFGEKTKKRNMKLSTNQHFQKGLKKIKTPINRKVFSTLDLKEYTFDVEYPENAIRYYYQIRNNLTHRGKGVHQDFNIVHNAFCELLCIVKYILSETKKDCEKSKKNMDKILNGY